MVVNAETERVIRRVLGDMLPKLNEMQRRQLQGSMRTPWVMVELRTSIHSRDQRGIR